ncbi:hypothetical protein DEJ34_14255 [Curtobacterium sp. MCPF17_050]|uniref:hypothetical protein n=1 Tax=Curtobacterium sp. MCPF17_050 TaxID=2175664 RepID=UPI0015E89E11|nr:hypothetical protein [Curtobacterium sp. MCPF17_050]WIB15278.1 hypothetical protein DEJ34_14255 [Curtobacterium sp. MCPF17_050]
MTTTTVLHAAASCASDAVPCDDGGATDVTGLFVTVVLVVSALVLLGIVLLGRQRR